MKKFISLLIVFCIAISVFSLPAVSAEAAESEKIIYFDASKWGGNIRYVYCHIYKRGGDSFYAWQSLKEKCTKTSGSIWKYDLSEIGLGSGTDYCVIFSNDLGAQTYDMTIGSECIGDTAALTGKLLENLVASEKTTYEAVWTTNNSKYGPHLSLSSTGNIIGSVFCPNESGVEAVGDWLPLYYNSPGIDVVSAVTNALLMFGVKDVNAVYDYILSKPNVGDPEIKKILDDAYAKAYPTESEPEPEPEIEPIPITKQRQKITAKSYTKTYGAKAFNLNAKTSGNGKLSYKSSNKKIVTVTSKGKITIKGCGKATITIKASSTSRYKSASKKITVTVKLGNTKIKSLRQEASRKIRFYITEVKGASGYQLSLSKGNTAIIKTAPGKNGTFSLLNLSVGKWKIKIRAYKTAGKTTTYSAWTSKKSFRITY